MDTEQHLRDAFRTANFLSREALASERVVQQTKWFDYRFLPAIEATELFADTYVRSFQRAWHELQDRDEAEHKRPLKPLFTHRSEFTALWNARLAADELGVPYPFFISQAIAAAVGRSCRKFPRPNQLAHELNVPIILAQWEKQRQATITYSRLAEYRTENYRDLPEQIAHQHWIVDQLKLVGASDHRIGTAVFVDRVLLESNAVSAFGAERVGLLISTEN